MNFIELKTVLARIDVDVTNLQPMSDTQVQINCVLAPWLHKQNTDTHPSLSIKFGDPPTLFKCFACGEGGKIWELVESYAVLARKEKLREFSRQLMDQDKPTLSSKLETIAQFFDSWVKVPENTKPVSLDDSILKHFNSAWSFPWARQYLLDRRVGFDICHEFDLRYDYKQQRIMFPVRDKNKILVGAVGRAVDNDNPKRYYNYFGFEAGKTLGGYDRITDHPRVIVVEGFFDLINCIHWADKLGCDVVCTWRAEMSEVQAMLLMELDKTVFVWYDSDNAGNKGWKVIKKVIGDVTFGLRRAKLPNDKDVGDLVEDEFVSIYQDMKGSLL